MGTLRMRDAGTDAVLPSLPLLNHCASVVWSPQFGGSSTRSMEAGDIVVCLGVPR